MLPHRCLTKTGHAPGRIFKTPKPWRSRCLPRCHELLVGILSLHCVARVHIAKHGHIAPCNIGIDDGPWSVARRSLIATSASSRPYLRLFKTSLEKKSPYTTHTGVQRHLPLKARPAHGKPQPCKAPQIGARPAPSLARQLPRLMSTSNMLKPRASRRCVHSTASLLAEAGISRGPLVNGRCSTMDAMASWHMVVRRPAPQIRSLAG